MSSAVFRLWQRAEMDRSTGDRFESLLGGFCTLHKHVPRAPYRPKLMSILGYLFRMPPGMLYWYWKLRRPSGPDSHAWRNDFHQSMLLFRIRANSLQAEIYISGCDKSASNTCLTAFRCFPVVSYKHPADSVRVGREANQNGSIHPSPQ